jgi:hypothetical protein
LEGPGLARFAFFKVSVPQQVRTFLAVDGLLETDQKSQSQDNPSNSQVLHLPTSNFICFNWWDFADYNIAGAKGKPTAGIPRSWSAGDFHPTQDDEFPPVA